MTVGMIGARKNTTKQHWEGKPTGSPDIERARQTDMIALAQQYTKMNRESVHEWSGPCPMCGGDDRLHVKGNAWFCRNCAPVGDKGWHNAIDFLMMRERMDFKTAVATLTGGNNSYTPPVRIRENQAEPVRQAEQSPEWIASAQAIVSTAINGLHTEAAGYAYLIGRGLLPSAWRAFDVGYAEHQGRPAIVIPWYRAGKPTAVRYRFLQTDGTERRMMYEPDSHVSGVLFGGQNVLSTMAKARTLILCEGELNAISIYQAAHHAHVDVLSFGSETARLSPAAIDIACQYQSVIVWADKSDIAREKANKIPGAIAFASPEGQDANDLLRADKLGGVITALRVRAARSDEQKAGIVWDIWDSHRADGIDAGSIAVARKTAAQLGIMEDWECNTPMTTTAIE